MNSPEVTYYFTPKISDARSPFEGKGKYGKIKRKGILLSFLTFCFNSFNSSFSAYHLFVFLLSSSITVARSSLIPIEKRKGQSLSISSTLSTASVPTIMPSTKMANGRHLDSKLIYFLAMMAQNPDIQGTRPSILPFRTLNTKPYTDSWLRYPLLVMAR